LTIPANLELGESTSKDVFSIELQDIEARDAHVLNLETSNMLGGGKIGIYSDTLTIISSYCIIKNLL
jgi:hypothetical protein